MRNVALLLALVVFATPARAPAAETGQCYTCVAAAFDPVYQHQQALAEQIDKQADGQLDIACHAGGALPVAVSTIAQSISQGTLQFGLIDSLSYNSLVQFAGVASLPGLFGNLRTGPNYVPVMGGTYKDRFRKHNGHWLFARKELVHDIAGDMALKNKR